MSEQMLHLRSPGRWEDIAGIVGDRAALLALRQAVDMALDTGAGGAFLFSSDGEGYALAVALEEHMWDVETAYADEVAPVRSLREVVPMHAVANFRPALHKAMRLREEFVTVPCRSQQGASEVAQLGAATHRPVTRNFSERGGVK